jgi:hypothetical protein
VRDVLNGGQDFDVFKLISILNIMYKRRLFFASLTYLFMVVCLNSCTRCDHKVVLFDYVELIQWEIVSEPYDNACGMYNQPCLLTLCPMFYYTSGKAIPHQWECYRCPEHYYNPDRFGKVIIKFQEYEGDLAKWITIEPHNPYPGLVIYTRQGGQTDSSLLTRDMCKEKYSRSEFEGAKMDLLNSFLDGLIKIYGNDSNGLNINHNNPKDICIYISPSEPLAYNIDGNIAYGAGSINCWPSNIAHDKNCRYQINLYDLAFTRANACVNEIYNTVAHEFKHILQSIELNLPNCDEATNRSELEREASNFAELLFPTCHDCNQ